MFKHLERFLMVKFPVPKRTFDMWVNVLEHAVPHTFGCPKQYGTRLCLMGC